MMMLLLSITSIALTVAAAAPQVAFPFNSQVPPVARVGAPFNFTLADTTFKSSDAILQYSISGGPAWLQFDASVQTLWGTPGAADAVSTEFEITASDGSNSVDMQCTLIVTANPAPVSRQDVSAVLTQAGNVTGPTSLLAHPQSKFEIDFSTGNYVDHGEKLYFYSTLANHTPLPAWLDFNEQTLHYAGNPPKLQSSPQSFEILLIASDVAGFAGVWDTFTVVVSDKTWAFEPAEQTISIAAGDTVNLDDLRSMLFIGDQQASENDIQQATAQIPSWLSFDQQSLAINGKPPQNADTTQVNITAYDHYGDSAVLSLRLQFNSLLNGSIGPIKVYPGQEVNYTIPRSSFVDPDLLVKLDAGSAKSWLHFDTSRLQLSGTVPPDEAPGTINLILTLTTSNNSVTDDSTIKLYIQSRAGGGNGPTSSSVNPTQSSSASPAATSTATPAAGSIGHVTSQTKGAIAAVVIGPILGVIAIILFVLYCCRPRPRNGKDPKSPSKSEISRPVASPDGEDADSDLEKGGSMTPVAAEHPPQLDFRLSPEKESQTPALSVMQTPKRFTERVSNVLHRPPGSPSIILEDGEADALDGFNRSSWGYGPHRAPSTRPHDSMKVPTAMARVSKNPSLRRNDLRSSTLSQQRSRQSRGYQRLPGRGHGRNSANHSSMSDSECAAGFGHGRHDPGYFCPYCPSTHYESGLPLQTHEEVAESSYGTDAPSMISSAQSGWPIPTAWQSTSASKMPKLSRLATTVRSVKAEKSGTTSETSERPSDLPDRRSHFEKRQSYLRQRALKRSPFFSSREDDSQSPKTSSADSGKPAGLGLRLSQPSLRTTASRPHLAREFSASSSLEPDTRRGRRRSKSKWKLPEGFPRALTPQAPSTRGTSRARNSIASALRYEDASPAEWERRSVSVYSDEAIDNADTVAGADRFAKSGRPTTPVAADDALTHRQPSTAPPLGPLPTPPPPPDIPSKSPRRSLVRPKSEVDEYPSDELPTIERPEIAVAVRKARLSKLVQGNKRRIDRLGSKRKEYPDLKRVSIMDRARADYRPALGSKRDSPNRRLGAHDNDEAEASGSAGMSKEKSWEDISGNEAFI